MRHGRSAPGLVRTIGPSRRGKLIFTVTVEVQPPDGSPFVAHAEVFVPLHAAGSLSPNKPIVARYDPATHAIAVDFEAMGYAPAP